MIDQERHERAIGYIRLSDFRGKGDPSTSPARQREAVAAYALARGWDLVEVVEDLDVSGSEVGLRLNRPGLKRVTAAFPDVDHVVIPSIDRLARNVVDFMTFCEDASRAGVSVASVREALDLSSTGGRFVAQILAAFAEHEASTIRSRVLAGNAAARSEGRFLGGTPPYGYRSAPHCSGAGRTLVVEPGEAAVVRAAASRILDDRWTLYRTVRDLNERQVPSKTGRQWTIQALRSVLTGVAVLGRTTHRGEVVRDASGLPAEFYEPVLEHHAWVSLRTILDVDRPSTGRRHNRPPARLLSRLVRCGLCGMPMNPSKTGGDGGQSYRCSAASRGWSTCRGVSIRCEPLERYVADEWLSVFGEMTITRTVTEVSDLPSAELAEVVTAIEATAAAMTRDDCDMAALGDQLQALKARRIALVSAPSEVIQVVECGQPFRSDWDDAENNVEERRRLLATCIDEVRVAPGRAGRRPINTDRVQILWAGNSL